MGLVCESICISIRNGFFADLTTLGRSVLSSLRIFGKEGVTNEGGSEQRLFVGVRSSCLHPLPTMECRVGRQEDVAMVGGNCVALFGRRCDLPGRCINGHIRIIFSTRVLRVCRNLGLIAARRESSAPCKCARGSSRSLPNHGNDCRGSVSRIFTHTKRVSGVVLGCLGRIRRSGGCPPVIFHSYHKVLSLRGGFNRRHLITTYTYTSVVEQCNCGSILSVLRGKSSSGFVPNSSRVLDSRSEVLTRRGGVENGRCCSEGGAGGLGRRGRKRGKGG